MGFFVRFSIIFRFILFRLSDKSYTFAPGKNK